MGCLTPLSLVPLQRPPLPNLLRQLRLQPHQLQAGTQAYCLGRPWRALSVAFVRWALRGSRQVVV